MDFPEHGSGGRTPITFQSVPSHHSMRLVADFQAIAPAVLQVDPPETPLAEIHVDPLQN
jgi:hypothetical protein